jgi:hypothetical protein
VPILIVGTKQDLVSAVRDGHRGNGMDEAGAETVNVVCISYFYSMAWTLVETGCLKCDV